MEKIINDFITDLSITFPEKREQWAKITLKNREEPTELTDYFSTVYPERFFDILYQNEEIFTKNNPDVQEINTCFLPEVDFAELFYSNISENTKKTIWRYLQLILFQVIENVSNKSAFGESANLFQGIDEKELQGKIKETVEGLKSFFQHYDVNREDKKKDTKEDSDEEKEEKIPNMFENLFQNMDTDNLQEHLKKLMGGKIGNLVKELVEEMKDEFSEFEKELGDIQGNPSMQEVIKRLMKNPAKMMNLMKKMTEKVKTKMQEGGNEEEFMKETSDMFKQMGGKDGIMKMFEEFKRSAPGGGKNMKIDKNALNRMQKQYETRERMKRNIAEKKKFDNTCLKNSVIEVDKEGNRVFRLLNGEKQEQSTKPEDIDALMIQYGLEETTSTKQPVANEVKDPKKKGKKGKNKK